LSENKEKCPFCGTFFFKGAGPDGISFLDKHLSECFERTPPHARSKPITVNIEPCPCGGTEFTFRTHYELWDGRPSLWEYGCKTCGQIQTALNRR
jgi:hypothetical protein